MKLVNASRGKVQRAEPVAALYAQGKVRHVGQLAELERQYCLFSTAGYMGARSPDHADAAIWGLTELMLNSEPQPNIRFPHIYPHTSAAIEPGPGSFAPGGLCRGLVNSDSVSETTASCTEAGMNEAVEGPRADLEPGKTDPA